MMNHALFVPVCSKRYKKGAQHPRRHHYVTCPECNRKVKWVLFHYHRHHPDFYERLFVKPLTQGKVGMISGFRFITSKKKLCATTV